MIHVSPVVRALGLLILLALAAPAGADPAVPGNVLDPRTPAEAWNVIRLSTANVEQLIREKRWKELPVQISFCSPALRALGSMAGDAEAAAAAEKAGGWVVALANAGLEQSEARTAETLRNLREQLAVLARHFDPKVVAADIFLCPMHPDFVSDLATTPCEKCGMTLIPRRIPYSFIYMQPGQPSVRMTAATDRPLEAGQAARVLIRMTKGDGAPVRPTDLLVLHTQPIHLLIQDPSLSDYHHEHPTATGTPGEYAFTFTPARTAPYRIWADIVPAFTGVQELPFVDLPAAGGAEPIADREDRFTCLRGGLKFELTFINAAATVPHARQTCGLRITVTEADGRPVQRLEPLMSAFAHLVGFYDDFQTVVHLHPGGGEILRADLRGGPVLYFTFYPPRAGFLRLYCQVQIEGKNIFAHFNLNVLP